jgi:hypothetical protein
MYARRPVGFCRAIAAQEDDAAQEAAEQVAATPVRNARRSIGGDIFKTPWRWDGRDGTSVFMIR